MASQICYWWGQWVESANYVSLMCSSGYCTSIPNNILNEVQCMCNLLDWLYISPNARSWRCVKGALNARFYFNNNRIQLLQKSCNILIYLKYEAMHVIWKHVCSYTSGSQVYTTITLSGNVTLHTIIFTM